MTNRAFRVLLVDHDQNDALATREMLSNTQVSAFQVSIVNSLLAALNLLALESFDVALVDPALPDSHGLEALATIHRHAPGMPVVLQTARGGESLSVKAVEQGAQDLLVKGVVTGDALVRVLTYSIARSRSNAEQVKNDPPKATVTGVLGAKGGAGATTLACYYALELASQTNGQVLLMDLDLSGASAAFLLKTTSECSVVDASMNLNRLDGEFWTGLVGADGNPIDLLPAPGVQRFDQSLEGERVRHVLSFARSRYDRIVIDLGRLNALSLTLVEEMKELYLATTVDLPALFEAARVLKRLIGLGLAPDQVRLVLNRTGKGMLGASPRDVERAVGYPVYAALGDFSAELAAAYGDGRFLAANLQLRRQIARFTAKTLGVEPKPKARFGRALLRLARA
jgi:Flp pilus assembly CpaE family ATPase